VQLGVFVKHASPFDFCSVPCSCQVACIEENR